MSWIQKLYDTYDRCAGRPHFDTNPLMPVDHAEQQVHIEITLSGSGKFRAASVVAKETTFIPATEESAGRTSSPAAHGLIDKLEYIAPDDGFVGTEASQKPSKRPKKKNEVESKHTLYVNQLRRWAASEPDPHVEAVLRYVEGGTILADLQQNRILYVDTEGKLLTRWENAGAPPALFKLLTSTAGERDQRSAVVRWIVELRDPQGSAQLWRNPQVHGSWQRFVAKQAKAASFCMVTGDTLAAATNHPKRLRHAADGAKLISSNDGSGYTFRGRFELPEQAYGVGSLTTQKAHNALRWLISRQGYKNGDQAIVAWAVSGAAIPAVVAGSSELRPIGDEPGAEVRRVAEQISQPPGATVPYKGDAGQLFARQVKRLIRGYAEILGDREDIVIMAVDSATPGRMAITYYRELKSSEFLDRIQNWHEFTAWPQNMGKDRKFIGAPAPRDIAEAAYGRRVDEKLRKATVERLLPCIVDGRPIPRDLMMACAQQATNRVGKERWEWERCLGVACALIRGTRMGDDYKMSLEEDRKSRSYLFGRLLAVAERIEGYSLYLAKETRDTSAERLMQRFADHPAETWRTIELALRPYMQRLQSIRPKPLYVWKRLLDDIVNRFQGDDFARPGRLDAEFLLGYHCQRSALRWDDSKSEGKDESSPETQKV